MKMCKMYAVLAAGLVLLLAVPTVSCLGPVAETEPEPAYTSEEFRQIEEAEFSALYRETKGYIERAHTLALGLANFRWRGLSRLGWISWDEAGHEKTNLLSEVMPAMEAAEPLLATCEESLARAVKVWSERPYWEAQTAVQQMQKLTIPEWRQLCGEVDSALVEADDQALQLGTVTGQFFVAVEGRIRNSGPGIERQYLEGFQMESAEYTALLDEVKYNLAQAKRATSELAAWRFASLQSVPSSAPATEPPPGAEGPPAEEPSQAWQPPRLPSHFEWLRGGGW